MKILHLYHDIMNLYGDYANVKAIERILEKNGAEFSTDKKTLGDDFRLSDYDFVFVGSGTERNQKVVLEDIRRFSDDLRAYIEAGKTALFTGNSFELLGKTITAADGEVFRGLDILGVSVKEQNKKRITSDVICEASFLDKPLVGFINKCGELSVGGDPLFRVTMGIGNSDADKNEGVRLKNFFGTHLTGPVLIKNPHFLVYIAGLVAGKPLNGDCLKYEKAGYEVTLRELRASF